MTSKTLERVLLVEDDPDIRTVAGLALEASGRLTVLACASGEEAVRLAPGFAPQIMLLDVMMPRMDGPATLAALRALPGLEKLPVVFMTAKVQAGETSRYFQLGAVDLIPKPFSPLALEETVLDIWRRAASGQVVG